MTKNHVTKPLISDTTNLPWSTPFVRRAPAELPSRAAINDTYRISLTIED